MFVIETCHDGYGWQTVLRVTETGDWRYDALDRAITFRQDRLQESQPNQPSVATGDFVWSGKEWAIASSDVHEADNFGYLDVRVYDKENLDDGESIWEFTYRVATEADLPLVKRERERNKIEKVS